MTAAAILTGGLARRFHGLDKSALVVDGSDPRPILDLQLARLDALVGDILIVTSAARATEFPASRLPAGVRVAIDEYPGTGPLGAVLTALDSTRAEAVLVLAADMPHVSAVLLASLVRLHNGLAGHDSQEPGADAHDATVPHSAHGPEPLCAVYAQSARPALLAGLESGDLSLRGALERLRVRVMPPHAVAALGDPDLLFRNINRPGDL